MIEYPHRNNNKWHFNPDTLELIHKQYGYGVDIEDCINSARLLDWIFQIVNKDWGADSNNDLLLWIQLLLEPQANLCSFGVDRLISVKKVLRGLRQRMADCEE